MTGMHDSRDASGQNAVGQGASSGGRPRQEPAGPAYASPELNGDTACFGWPVVNRLLRTTAAATRTSGGKTVSVDLVRQHSGPGTLR